MIYDDYNNVALDQVGSYSIARGLCDPLGMSQFFMHCAWFLNCSGFVDLSGCYFGEVGTLCVDFWEHPLWMAQRTSVLEMRPLIFCGGRGGGEGSRQVSAFIYFFSVTAALFGLELQKWAILLSHFFFPLVTWAMICLPKKLFIFIPIFSWETALLEIQKM